MPKHIYSMGVARLRQGGLEEAISHFETTLEADPDHRDARAEPAAVLRANDDFGASEGGRLARKRQSR